MENDKKRMPYTFISRYVKCSVITGILLASISSGWAETETAIINFTANFVGGGCEVNLPATLSFNNGDILFNKEIEQGVPATLQVFNLTLRNCIGMGFTPTITVNGQKTTEYGPALFRNIMGPNDAKGYGVLLTTSGNKTFSQNNNLAENGVIKPSSWSVDNKLESIDITLPMRARLTCGNCSSPGRQGGEFRSTVTFDFLYE